MSEVFMPRLSDSMVEGTIVRWLKADGDEVAEGEEIVEIETDKATLCHEAENGGVLHILANAGITVPVGTVIADIGPGGPLADAANGRTLAGAAARTGPSAFASGANRSGAAPTPAARVRGDAGASPLARRVAARLGVELAGVDGSGPSGRILKRDVVRAADVRAASRVDVATGEPAAAAPVASVSEGAVEDGLAAPERLTRTQQLIARRMADARATVPEFHVEVEVEMSAAAELRRQFAQLTDTPPSYNDLIIKASAVALRRHPRVNGCYRETAFELHPAANIGFAVSTDDALIVPIIAGADTKSLGTIAEETRDLIQRARARAISPGELEGATFTVSNLGMFGVVRFGAIPNMPQAAILSVGAIVERPVARDGEVAIRPMMSLTLACDHRIVYGAAAAAFLSDLRALLEHPLTIAL